MSGTSHRAGSGPAWSAISASVRGASHDRSGLPNQDAVLSTGVLGVSDGLVAAVSDGHGGARYVRSDVGSLYAVEVACQVGSELIAGVSGADALRTERALRQDCAASIVSAWRRRVLLDVEARPFTDEERTRGGANLEREPLVAYGCTLVLALLTRSWVGLVQIGDGDAFVISTDGAVGTPVPGDDRLVGGETTSLCLPTAVDDARVAMLTGTLPEMVVLCTDGYGNSFASPDWRRDAGGGLLDAVRNQGLDDVATKLPAWLADSAKAGGDDVTMALIERRAARGSIAPDTTVLMAPPADAVARPLNAGAVAAGSGTAAPAPAPNPGPTAVPTGPVAGRSRSSAWLGVAAAALVVGGAVGGLIGWKVGAGRDAAAVAVDPGTSTTITEPSTSTSTSTPTWTRRAAVITGSGVVVAFNPVAQGDGVQPVVVGSGTFDSVTRIGADSIAGNRLTLGSDASKKTSVDLGRQLGSMLRIDDVVWVLSADGRALRAVSATTRGPLFNWVPIAGAGNGN